MRVCCCWPAVKMPYWLFRGVGDQGAGRALNSAAALGRGRWNVCVQTAIILAACPDHRGLSSTLG